MIRSAYGLQDESGKPWYSEYFSIAQELGIISNETLSSLDKTPITREKLANWLYQVERANADASASSRDGDTALYEIEADGPSDCSSFEIYDTTRKVCAFECKTELECKMTQEKIDAELAGWTDSLEGTNRDTPTGETESTPANTKVLYSVNTGEALTFKNGTDTVEYRNLWKELAGLSPDTISDRFIENFEVYADSGSDIIAFVSDDDRNGKWKMSINLPTHKLTDIK